MFEFSKPIANILFSGSAVTEEQVDYLAKILSVGALQLPVSIVAAVLTKTSAINGASSKAVLAAVSGLMINLVLDWALAPSLGVLGIAVASLLATVAATLYLAFATRKQCGLKLNEISILIHNWILISGACISLNSESYAAMGCAILALCILGWAQVKYLKFSD
jgi:peptidoglycan biosynthesis protein MviN/MurJ (putative lipid II flippase)